MIATASAAMAKGDTVYFENQVGEWTDVTGDVGFTPYTYRAGTGFINTSGTKVYATSNDRYDGNLYVYDTTTTPWTRRQVQSTSGITFDHFGQDGDIASCITDGKLYLLDLNTEELIVSGQSLTGKYSNNIPLNNIYLFDNYVCSGSSSIRISDGYSRGGNYTNTSGKGWITESKYLETGTGQQILEFMLDSSGSLSELYRQTIPNENATSIIPYIANGKAFFISIPYTSQYSSACYVINDLDTTPWVIEKIQLPIAFNFWGTSNINLSADKTKLVVADTGNKVLAILDTSTLQWNVIDYFTSSSNLNYIVPMMGGNYAIFGPNVFRNTGAGTIAHKAYNNLHGSRSLGYALKDMSAGEKAKYRVLFD